MQLGKVIAITPHLHAKATQPTCEWRLTPLSLKTSQALTLQYVALQIHFFMSLNVDTAIMAQVEQMRYLYEVVSFAIQQAHLGVDAIHIIT